MFSHTQFLLIKHKMFFECFSCFWKVFCFFKNCQKFQKQCCLVLATWSWVSPVACPQSRALFREYSRLIGGSKSQSRKILRIVSKSRFLGFSQLRLATCSQVEGTVARVIPKVSRLNSRLSRGWNFQSQKKLRKFFQNFCL